VVAIQPERVLELLPRDALETSEEVVIVAHHSPSFWGCGPGPGPSRPWPAATRAFRTLSPGTTVARCAGDS
jgi:hypothetical protein